MRQGALNVTMHEIAAKLGISRTTVYRVVYDKPGVKDETRRAVLALLKEHNYVPNDLVRSLRQNRTGSIGIVTTNPRQAVWPQLLQYIVAEVGRKGYEVILQTGEYDTAQIDELVERLCRKRVDGILVQPGLDVFARSSSDLIRRLIDQGYPIVCLSGVEDWQSVDWVSTDRAYGVYAATAHLIELGHKEIGLVLATRRSNNRITRNERIKGYKRALEEYEIAFCEDHLIYSDDSGCAGGDSVVRQIVSKSERPSALVFLNDLMAMGAVYRLTRMGYRVPRDMAIVGFDDLPTSGYGVVGLTTVRQPLEELASESVRLLFDRLERPSRAPRQVYIRPTLVVRESSDPEAER